MSSTSVYFQKEIVLLKKCAIPFLSESNLVNKKGITRLTYRVHDKYEQQTSSLWI